MEKKQIILNNLLINYYSNNKTGSSYNVIFLHGWRSEGKIWNKIMDTLPFSAYALDLPGFGESQLPNNAYTLVDFVITISDFINKQKLENIVLVGHSNGGAIAIKSALLNQFQIAKLVLVDSAGIRKKSIEKSTKNIIAKIVSPIFRISFMKPLRDKIYESMGSEDYVKEPQLKETYLNMIGEDLSNQLSNINVATLLIWGDKDLATPLSDAQFMKSSISGSELEIIEGAGHFSFLEDSDIFLKYLNEFLIK